MRRFPEPPTPSAGAPVSVRTTAVVVTWNAARHVAATLSGLPADVELVVVDNASTDATVEVVEGVAPHAVIIRNTTNRGFSAAVNQALRVARGADYVLLLNPDAMVSGESISALVDHCDRHPEVGVASATITDASGAAERFAGGCEPSLRSVAIHELGLTALFGARSLYRPGNVAQAEDRDWVAGTCALVRRRAIEEVGQLDEAYFLYAEDIDWCRRFREAGWRVCGVPGATAVHNRSTSVNQAGAWIDAHRMGSLDEYYRRRHGRTSLLAFRCLRGVGAAGRGLVYGLTSRGDPARRALARRRLHDARLAIHPRRVA